MSEPHSPTSTTHGVAKQNPNAVKLTVKTKTFTCESFKIYSIHSVDPPKDQQEKCDAVSPKSPEEKLAIEALVSHIQKSHDVIAINHKSLIVFGGQVSCEDAQVILKVYEGKERPDGLETYQRVVDRKQRVPFVRWVRVERIERGRASVHIANDVVNKENSVPAAIGPKSKEEKVRVIFGALAVGDDDDDATNDLSDLDDGFTRFQASFRLDDTGAKYGDELLQGLVDAAKQNDDLALGAVRALLKRKHTAENGTAVMVRDSFFGEKADAALQGVEVRFGVTKSLHRISTDTVVLSEKPCRQLFYRTTSLAAFMDTHHRALATAPTVENRDSLSKAFRGLQVKVVPASDAEVTLASVYRQCGTTLKYPDLPCVDVGSKARPFYVPAEACSILPSQPFRNELSPTFQRELEGLYRPDEKSDQSNSRESSITEELTSEPEFHVPIGRNWQTSFMNNAHVLLVEVGKGVGDGPGQKQFNQPAWIDFMRVFTNMSKRNFHAGADQDGWPIASVKQEPLRLAYVPGQDCSAGWTAELKTAVTKSDVPAQQVAVVFGIQNTADHSEIFKQMKKACDGGDLGVQSMGVNLATLRRKVAEDPSSGLVCYSGQIFHKMFARTPKTEELARGEDFAVGIHVTQLAVSKVERSQFLVAMALRDVHTSKVYGTLVTTIDATGVLQPMEALAYIFTDLVTVSGVLHGLQHGRLIVIFRSGCALPSSTATTGNIQTRDEGLDSLRAALASEFDILAETVAEHRLIGLRVEEKGMIDLSAAREAIAKSIDLYRQVNDKDDQRSSKGVYFTRHATDGYFVHLPSAGSVKQSLMPTSTLTDRKGSLTGSPKTSPPSTPISSTARRRSGASLLDGSPRSHLSPTCEDEERRKPSEPAADRKAPASRTATPGDPATDLMDVVGRETMAKLFYDNHLGVHESKWPVPILLAKRAAAWATTHMRVTRTESTTKYEVPAVHDNRKKTLWYL